MASTKLPAESHVVRYVRKQQLRRDGDDRVLGVLPQAFQLRPDEEYLSVTWLEHFSTDYTAGIKASAAAIRAQLTVKPKDGFSVGKVQDIAGACGKHSVAVRILHEPEALNLGHSAIRQLPRDNMDLLALLADDAFLDTRVTAELDKHT